MDTARTLLVAARTDLVVVPRSNPVVCLVRRRNRTGLPHRQSMDIVCVDGRVLGTLVFYRCCSPFLGWFIFVCRLGRLCMVAGGKGCYDK